MFVNFFKKKRITTKRLWGFLEFSHFSDMTNLIYYFLKDSISKITSVIIFLRKGPRAVKSAMVGISLHYNPLLEDHTTKATFILYAFRNFITTMRPSS